jgi:hypothetical protein
MCGRAGSNGKGRPMAAVAGLGFVCNHSWELHTMLIHSYGALTHQLTSPRPYFWTANAQRAENRLEPDRESDNSH